MTLTPTLRKQIGELIITGFQGKALQSGTREFLKTSGIGGVLLFAHNYDSPGQVAELNNQIQECRGELPLWISVDHEGGKVQRFRKGFTRIPEAERIGKMGSAKLAYDVAEVMASELRAVGVNLNFCPIADIHTNPANPVIGDRAFGSEEDLVSKMSSAVVRGHLKQGVQPCVKHFPGHGDTHLDSHFALPRVDTPLEILQEREFLPFAKSFRSKCSMVMTAHLIASKLDPECPATFSKRILKEWLRDYLKYSKIIISDDLEMKAVTDHFGAAEAPILALEAGCNLLIYRTEEAARIGYEAIVRAVESGRLSEELIVDSFEKSQEVKKSLPAYQAVNPAEVSTHLATEKSLELISQIT